MMSPLFMVGMNVEQVQVRAVGQDERIRQIRSADFPLVAIRPIAVVSSVFPAANTSNVSAAQRYRSHQQRTSPGTTSKPSFRSAAVAGRSTADARSRCMLFAQIHRLAYRRFGHTREGVQPVARIT
jgi:hypothetical protein